MVNLTICTTSTTTWSNLHKVSVGHPAGARCTVGGPGEGPSGGDKLYISRESSGGGAQVVWLQTTRWEFTMSHSKFTISDTWAMGEGWWEPWWDGGSGTGGRTSCKCQDKRIFWDYACISWYKYHQQQQIAPNIYTGEDQLTVQNITNLEICMT